MATDDRDYGFLGVIAADLTKEARGTDDIEGGDTEQTMRVENTSLFERLGNDRYR